MMKINRVLSLLLILAMLMGNMPVLPVFAVGEGTELPSVPTETTAAPAETTAPPTTESDGGVQQYALTTVVDSGSCGEGLTWSLDDAGTLIISGSGAMTDYATYADTPWYGLRDSITKIVVGSGVTAIDEGAFSGCRYVTDLTIPFVGLGNKDYSGNGLFHFGMIFGTESFYDTYYIHKQTGPMDDPNTQICYYYIPGSLRSVTVTGGQIQSRAFEFCESLTSITLGDGVTAIASDGFYGCHGVTTLAIGAGVSRIETPAFDGMPALETVVLAEENPYYCVDWIGFLCDKDETTVLYAPRSLSGFVYLSDSVTEIAPYAFSGCKDMTMIDISNVTKIGENAFYNCTGLETVRIPEGVESLGACAFYDCTGLTAISLPKSMKEVNSQDFYNANIKHVFYSGTEIEKYSIDGYSYLSGTWYYNAVDSGTVEFGKGPLYWCLDQDGTLTVCGDGAMTDVPDAPESAERWLWYQHKDKIKKVVVAEGVTHIGENAFDGYTGLESVTFASTVTGSGMTAFSGCTGLTSVQIPSGAAFGSGAFGRCTGLKTVILNEGVVLYAGLFYGCTGLETVIFPADIDVLRDGVFSDCTALKDVYYGGTEAQKAAIDFGSGNEYLEAALWHCSCTDAENHWTTESKEPTCTETGYEKEVCICGYSRNEVTKPTAEHDYQSGACSVCGAIQTIASGNCGTNDERDNATWKLDADGTLTISGTGKMGQYIALGGEEPDFPWYAYRKQIKSVVIEEGITNVGSAAFLGCTNLTDVTLADSVTIIEWAAFQNCSGLTEFTIPDTVTMIEMCAFAGCSGLTSVAIPEGIPYIDQSTFYGCTGLTSVTIPDSVTRIEYSAFKNCAGLKSVTIPDSVTYMGEGVFSGCTGLTSVTIPDSVTAIGDYAFEDCTGLKSITIPEGVTFIGGGAFSGCTGLSDITIPNGVTEINFELFSGCTGLTSVTIPNSVTEIAYEAFSGCTGLTSVTIPDGVTYMGESVFSGCTGLTEITIPGSVTRIGMFTFSGCTGLTSVTILDGVTGIGFRAFENCTGLTSITIPAGVASIGYDAFYGCTGLTGIWVDENNSNYSSDSKGVLFNKDKTEIICVPGGKTGSYTVPDRVGEIGPMAFAGCIGLTEITIPAGVVSIGYDAFYGCTGLTGIWVDENNSNYSSDSKGVLFNKDKTEIICVPGGMTGSYTVPDGVARIESSFAGCTGLTEITIPASVTEIIHYSAFSGCSSLTGIWVDGENPNYSSDSRGVLFDKTKTALLAAPQGIAGSYTIPDGVTSVGLSAFSGCKGLTEVNIPEGVTTMHSGAFSGCTGLTHVTIPAGMDEIQTYAFGGCTNLTTVTLPKSVEFIHENAFSGCTGLEEVFYGGHQYSMPGDMGGNELLWNALWHYECTDAENHWVVDSKEPTCVEDGYENKTCPCGYVRNRVKPATGDHIYDQQKVAQQYKVSDATCTAPAEYHLSCACGAEGTDTFQIGEAKGHSWTAATCTTPKTCSVCTTTQGVAAGHSLGQWVVVKAATPAGNGQEKRTCQNCTYFETGVLTYKGNGIVLTGDLAKQTTVYIEGLPYEVKSDGSTRYVELPKAGDTLLVTYTFHTGDGKDVHTQYPTGMKVYKVSGGKATRISELDNLLQYSGSSIRITGNKGIRMITSIEKTKKAALTGTGLAGYTLEEYGTVLCFAKEIKAGDGLVLGRSFARSNFAYKKGVADPVFASTDKLVQYTNVLVGFSLDQCKDDIAMRPYIILKDAKGQKITLYGGTIYRSIGYIAYQNRNVFTPKTASYNYVWEIIHHVFGKQYDKDYKG